MICLVDVFDLLISSDSRSSFLYSGFLFPIRTLFVSLSSFRLYYFMIIDKCLLDL